MFSSNRSAFSLGLVVILAIVAWDLPSDLYAQQGPHRPSAVPREATFVAYDESVDKAADAFLAASDRAMNTMAPKETLDETMNGIPLIDQQTTVAPTQGWTASQARVQSLLPLIEPILRSRGVPTDLSAVVLVESGGREMALSTKGARGIWQLMPDTARRYGLQVNEREDERLDPVKATDAAARYLHDLFVQFADWKLALAAYNAGEHRIGSALLKSHSQEFEQLATQRMLPMETVEYVPRVIAAMHAVPPTIHPGQVMPVLSESIVFAPSTR